jgi:hypothetical protein
MGGKWFANVTGVHRVVLPDDEWVEFKAELSVSDQQMIYYLLFRPTEFGEDGKPKQSPQLRPDTSIAAEIAVALVGWSAADEDGPVPVPATAEDRAKLIGSLAPERLSMLREAYTGYFRSKAAEEKKASTPITIGPS